MKKIERLDVAIQGFGFMGRMHAQAWQRIPGARVVAVVDVGVAGAETAARDLGLTAKVFSDLAEAVAETGASVVDTCLPTDLHLGSIEAAAKMGRAILCEKPLTGSMAGASAILDILKKHPVPFMTAQCIRFWPEYRYLVALVGSARRGEGDLGALLSLNLTRQSGRPAGGAGGWISDPARSNGAALDMHIHDTDFICSLFGSPTSVMSRGTTDGGGMTHIFTDYEYGGPIVRAEGGWNYPAQWGFRMAYQAIFEKGVLDYDSRGPQTLVLTREGQSPQPVTLPKPSGVEGKGAGGNITDLGGYLGEIEYFSNCLLAGNPIEEATAEQAAESLRVTLTEIESARRGAPQNL